MLWSDIRHQYPQQWVLVEALQAHSEAGQRVLNQLAVVDRFPDSVKAMKAHQTLHRSFPHRELYVLHTSREQLNIGERYCLRIRDIT